MRSLVWTCAGLASLVCISAAAVPDFTRDIRPVLERSCLPCHGPEKQKSGYRLDSRAAALRGGESGEPAIVPHDAGKSRLIRLVSGKDPDLLMPPKSSDRPRLTSAEIVLLHDWINAGPAWPESASGTKDEAKPHWSLTPLRRPPKPRAGGNPIDAFVQAKLAAQKLKPSPEADRRTLLRRLSYDLTGLPPIAEDTQAFVADRRPQAYAKIVDRLLASPRYGEHWGRHWLDVAHYADTHGNDHDHARPHAWPYRDYVIQSFNQDKPYVRFVQEQIAGDALFPNDPQATVALGFLAAGPWDDTLMVGVREDTYDHRLSQSLDRDDMVTTVMSSFQGLTVHCARCHDHKFDPIRQREYYALQAVFAGVDRADRPFDDDPATHARRRALLERKAGLVGRTPAMLTSLETPEWQQRIAALQAAQERRRAAWRPLEIQSVASASGADTRFERQQDESWFVSGARPDKDIFIVTAAAPSREVRAIRLEALPDERLPGHGPGRYDPAGNFHLSEFRVLVSPAGGELTGAVPVGIARATADHSDGGDMIANAIDGRVDTFWSIHPLYGAPHEAVFEFKEPLTLEAGATLLIRLEHEGKPAHQLGRFRLTYCGNDLPTEQRAPWPAAVLVLLRKPEAQRTPEERRELALRLLTNEIEQELATLPAPRWVYAATHDFPPNGSFKPARVPRPIHVLTRGELDKPGEQVEPGALGCLPGLSAALIIADLNDESARRAALARWLTDQRNPLLWRTIVNRVWHYHFGRGLCDTPNDFGKMGGTPSHAELLDWLAVWFRDEAKGSLKALHRLIVTSATYRQAVTHQLAAEAVDADNRLLWRMNRLRLTAEEVRDSLLQASGQLDLAMGGPSVLYFNQRGKATFMPDGGAPAFVDYEGFNPDAPENRRRAVYRFVFRTVPDPFMDALDAPDGGSLTPVRNQSTTAVQAFALMNNAWVIRQCEHLAERVKTNAPAGQEIVVAFRWLLQRDPSPTERARFAAYAEKHGLANACQVLLNTNEFLYLD